MSISKPIRRLFYQFGGLLRSPRLDAEEIFFALQREGLVEASVLIRSKVERYVETKAMQSIDPKVFRLAVRDALVRYCSTNCISPIEVADDET